MYIFYVFGKFETEAQQRPLDKIATALCKYAWGICLNNRSIGVNASSKIGLT